MKIKLKKSWMLVGIVVLTIIISFVVIPNLFVTLMGDVVKKDPASAYNLSFGDTESLGIIYGDTRVITEWSGGEDFEEQEITSYRVVDGQTVPVSNKTQLYCADYGTEFWTSSATKHAITDFENTYGSITHYNRGNPNDSYFWYQVSRSGHVEATYDGEVTYPWLVKTGDVDLLTREYIDLAYILTSPDIGQYNDEKQRAIWARNEQVPANDLYKEAEQYIEYYQATQLERGSTDLPDINIEGSVDDIKVMAHYDEKDGGTITIGPINLTYINKNNDEIAFCGISSMYFRGYNSEGEKINNHIKIEKYIAGDGIERELEFFETDEENCFVDHDSQSYPNGKEQFYVIIKNPNVGKTSADEDFISELNLCIEFQWMTIFDARASDMNAYEYVVDWYSHGHDSYHYKKYGLHCRRCYRFSQLDENELQKVLNYYGGARELFTRTVFFEGIDITMDLGGSVWEDGVATKETKADGVNTTQGVDKPLSNIKVNLWAYNESLWGDQGKFVTYTYTDEDGNYMFEKLNSLLKYYVTFEYNGQQYLPTEYLKVSNTGSYNSAKEMADAGEYNQSEQWHITSKGTETPSDRDSYDQTFAEIGSAPKNYQSSDSLGSGKLVEGYNEAFSMYTLMGFVLGEDGKYYIDQNLALLDGFYTVKDGVIAETEELQEGRISKAIKEYMSNYEDSEREKLKAELDTEFDKKIDEWNKKVDSYINDPNVENLEGQRASGIKTLEKQKANRLEYIEKLTIVPDYDEMIKAVYTSIAGNDTEMWRKLQFIEDCKMTSYTQNNNQEKDLYPVYDDIYINRIMEDSTNNGMENKGKEYDTIKEKQNDSYDQTEIVKSGKTYKPIYEGQFFINQGLWKRQEYDVALRKDVYRATMKINDKTVVYKYDKRAQQEDGVGANSGNGNDNNTYWDINVRMSDYGTYYDSGYNRELYLTDYDYGVSLATNHPGKPLEIYVTYKITVRNQSMSILTQIKEVVDYYDKDYTYREDLSWVTFKDNGKTNTVTDAEYYNAMVAEKLDSIKNSQPIKSSNSSKYGASTHSDITKSYNAVYVNGLEGKKLASGESAYIYLTFQVNKGTENKVILDEANYGNGNTDTPKMNYAEVNGYTTFYKDNTELPNGITKGSNDVAGLIDRDSVPGNLEEKDITDGNKPEKNFEDDTDRSQKLRVIIDGDAIRKANGTVWEDERTVTAGESKVGDGIMQKDETKIAGVKVQLVEKCTNGQEYVWYQTTTDANGHYDFANYIPGNYVVRFYYGNDTDTVKIKGNGGSNDVSYNGQDFKSTTYQAGMTQSDITNKYEPDTNKQFKGYNDIRNQNETGTYGYDIYQADLYNKNVSDAKDLWTTSKIVERLYNTTSVEQKNIQGRLAVNDYSDENVTNHKAEVLASPYERPSYNNKAYTDDQMNALINELITNTYMTAETGVIDVEFEYDRQLTDGYNSVSNGNNYLYSNDFNGNFTLNNIDFGLVERPKAQLEIDKSVTNVKLTLANGSVLFDVNKTADNVIWKDHTEYELEKYQKDGKYEEYYGASGKNRYSYRNEKINSLVKNNDNGLIQLTMDEELMHGATIEITYKVKITNVGEVDYEGQEFYYLGKTAGNVVTTTANQVVDYVANNLKFDSNNTTNNGWEVIAKDSLIKDKSDYKNNDNLVNSNLSNNVAQFNDVIETSGSELNKILKPGESTEKTLILSQLITAENSDDDLTYTNMVEIVRTSNTVGRRMAYSVVGNQDPKSDQADELDSSTAEKVIILPPFGEAHIYYILGAVVALILVGGIALIIRKVLKK